jgi:hypothetical protein
MDDTSIAKTNAYQKVRQHQNLFFCQGASFGPGSLCYAAFRAG